MTRCNFRSDAGSAVDKQIPSYSSLFPFETELWFSAKIPISLGVLSMQAEKKLKIPPRKRILFAGSMWHVIGKSRFWRICTILTCQASNWDKSIKEKINSRNHKPICKIGKASWAAPELIVHDLVKQTETLWGFISVLWLEIRKRTFASLQMLGVKEAPIPKLFSRGLETFVHLVPWQKGSTCGNPAEMWPQVEKTEIIYGLSVSPAGSLRVLICAALSLLNPSKPNILKSTAAVWKNIHLHGRNPSAFLIAFLQEKPLDIRDDFLGWEMMDDF